MGTVLTHCGIILDAGVLKFDESFDSCITTTLTLFLSSTTGSYVSLLPIPLALSCRTLNVLSSLICSADGAELERGVIAGSLKPSRGRRSNLYISDTVLHLRVRNISHASIQNMLHW